MSINQFSQDTTQTTTLWWTQQPGGSRAPPIPNNPFSNLNFDDDVENTQLPLYDDESAATSTPQEQEPVEEEEKEVMFEKALTPSDVGKLNRLVIPKQHAEKYFPLGGGDSAESKGMLLSFEDESRKCWRFRYSYWNSSQSYILTKGWSRYVKDKHLGAGDVVLFQRHRVQANRLFIGWRRRQVKDGSTAPAHVSKWSKNGNGGVPVGWPGAHPSYPAHHHSFAYQPDSLHAGGGSQQGQKQTTPLGNSSSSRVLRLFGVNMECQPDNDSETLSSCNMSSTHHNESSDPLQSRRRKSWSFNSF